MATPPVPRLTPPLSIPSKENFTDLRDKMLKAHNGMKRIAKRDGTLELDDDLNRAAQLHAVWLAAYYQPGQDMHVNFEARWLKLPPRARGKTGSENATPTVGVNDLREAMKLWNESPSHLEKF
jgi:uncharacterized protein YkwD